MPFDEVTTRVGPFLTEPFSHESRDTPPSLKVVEGVSVKVYMDLWTQTETPLDLLTVVSFTFKRSLGL